MKAALLLSLGHTLDAPLARFGSPASADYLLNLVLPDQGVAGGSDYAVLSISFGMGHVFGSAMVQPAEDSMNNTETFWAWGVTNGYGPKINSWYSTDQRTWINGTAFEIKNSTEVGFEGMCNNAVTRLDTPKGEPPAYVMAIASSGGPLVGKAYLMATFAYLNGSDLSKGADAV